MEGDSNSPATEPDFPVASGEFPVDLYITKRPIHFGPSYLTVTDFNGDPVFTVHHKFRSKTRLLLDSSKNPILSIHENGLLCEAFRVIDGEKRDKIFSVKRSEFSRFKTELEVFIEPENIYGNYKIDNIGDDTIYYDNQGEEICDLVVKGSPYRRSCSVYRGCSIVAQMCPLHRLRRIVVGRFKFRLTLFPGVDQALILALIVIFLK
ncbi:hypothetical protein AMTRI_Chr08g167490 [Amborella trichopoda]|uniref:Tubby C-terminal domain-containing protein n=1 Tax=Amborella trichopoda TaxID=13333 RepID=W1PCD5_AMBTC|nr:protein LURP-one-related 15 [Amborella trichopoda]ERN05369.1 hypothetical protein AMTR_s00007p00203970 [Amborella trichopoda]|eukprot:XP_006843694.1 protein LURP-one-related 15 [Amborella trichopoda]